MELRAIQKDVLKFKENYLLKQSIIGQSHPTFILIRDMQTWRNTWHYARVKIRSSASYAEHKLDPEPTMSKQMIDMETLMPKYRFGISYARAKVRPGAKLESSFKQG